MKDLSFDSREIIINMEHSNSKAEIAITENGVLSAFFPMSECQWQVGDIYVGKVCDIINKTMSDKGTYSAFIDIGKERRGFISDVSDIKPGDFIIAQVASEEHDSKGLKFKSSIKLSGINIVLLPGQSGVYISQAVTSKEQRDALYKRFSDVLQEFSGIGIIVRSQAAICDIDEKTIREEIQKLKREWDAIQRRFCEAVKNKTPCLLYKKNDVFKILESYPLSSYSNIYVNDTDTANDILKEYPSVKNRVHFINTKDYNIFDIKGIRKEIENINKRKIWLKSGGYIIIEKTEAMYVIDVNSGKCSGVNDISFEVNKEAADEIMKQIRLRNLGGIIICDFINMNEKEKNEELLRLMKAASVKDPSRPKIYGMTHLGLVEIARKRS